MINREKVKKGVFETRSIIMNYTSGCVDGFPIILELEELLLSDDFSKFFSGVLNGKNIAMSIGMSNLKKIRLIRNGIL